MTTSCDPAPLVDALATHGWCATPHFIDSTLCHALRAEGQQLLAARAMRAARIGRDDSLQHREDVRGDLIAWLDPAALSPAQRVYNQRLEDLRRAVNATLFLGAFDIELHFACYPPGARYQKHMDRHRDTQMRLLSCILYLNEEWNENDGGQLRLYLPDAETRDITPRGGTLVTFLSDQFPHEVLPARRERWSITGWMRARDTRDPP